MNEKISWELLGLAAGLVLPVVGTSIKKAWDNSKLKEAAYMKELLDTKKSLTAILDETNRSDQPVFFAKIKSLLDEVNNEIYLHATKPPSSFKLKRFGLEMFQNVFRNLIDVVSAVFLSFVFTLFNFGMFHAVGEWLKETGQESYLEGFFLTVEGRTILFFYAGLTVVLALLTSYKKYYSSCGFMSWLKKNMVFGMYAVLYFTIATLILRIIDVFTSSL